MFRTRKLRVRNRKSKPVRLRPRLEVLEDRILLSTFTVLHTLAFGPGSLGQAILDANANPGLDTIAFCGG